jgi:3-oxochol-4-en-24-oyl-CoA dehydrogenase
MALAVTDEHRQLAEAVTGWAERHSPPGTAREAIDGAGLVYREKLAPGLASQGLLGLHLPETAGGQGYGLPELAVAVAELGRALVPGAFLPTVLASAVLAANGTAQAAGTADDGLSGQLSGLADGTLTGAVALGTGMRAAVDGTGAAAAVTIDGTCGPVLGAPVADLVILPAAQVDHEIWVVAAAADLTIAPADGLDLTRPAGLVSAERLVLPAGRVLGGLRPGAVTSLAAVLLAA